MLRDQQVKQVKPPIDSFAENAGHFPVRVFGGDIILNHYPFALGAGDENILMEPVNRPKKADRALAEPAPVIKDNPDALAGCGVFFGHKAFPEQILLVWSIDFLSTPDLEVLAITKP